MSDIEPRLLRYFIAVAEKEHFAQAAERLGITPPTLTHQIKKLERQLGAKLLIRKGNTKVVITEAGQRVLAGAREMLRQGEEIKAAALQAGRGELGRLQIGFVAPLLSSGLLRHWIGAFKQAHPAIDIMIRNLVPMAQITGLMRKELDAGFARPPHKYPSGVRGFEIYRQPLVLALPRDHALARHEDISPAMLAHETFVKTTPELDVGFSGLTKPLPASANSYRAWSSATEISWRCWVTSPSATASRSCRNL